VPGMLSILVALSCPVLCVETGRRQRDSNSSNNCDQDSRIDSHEILGGLWATTARVVAPGCWYMSGGIFPDDMGGASGGFEG